MYILRMARDAPTRSCDPEDRRELERLVGSRTESMQMVGQSQILLCCLACQRVHAVARSYRARPTPSSKWRQRFVQSGLAGSRDAPRPGANPVFGAESCNRLLALLEEPLPAGQACWDGPAVAAALGGSAHAVWRVLRQEVTPRISCNNVSSVTHGHIGHSYNKHKYKPSERTNVSAF